MPTVRPLLAAALLAVCSTSSLSTALAGPFGPTPYLETSDSPFDGLGLDGFQLDTFEDHLLNVVGVSGSVGSGVTSVVFGPSIHDSVDADDGAIDGSGLGGDSYFSSSGSVQFTFDADARGGLPTHAGVVWTDGGGNVTFQAFDSDGGLLGTIGPDATFPDASVNGETAEDRFFGFEDERGIGSILISNAGGGIEIDHLQYGGLAGDDPDPTVVPLPPAAWTGLLTLAGAAAGTRLFPRWRLKRLS